MLRKVLHMSARGSAIKEYQTESGKINLTEVKRPRVESKPTGRVFDHSPEEHELDKMVE